LFTVCKLLSKDASELLFVDHLFSKRKLVGDRKDANVQKND